MNSLFKKICIASDHGGYILKEAIKDHLINSNISIYDLGPNDNKTVDYPDFAKRVANRIKLKKSEIGILVCGSGTGMAISANKIKGVRAAVCYNEKSTRLSRQHNNANIIALGARLTKKNLSLKLVDIFLKTKFEGGRHSNLVFKKIPTYLKAFFLVNNLEPNVMIFALLCNLDNFVDFKLKHCAARTFLCLLAVILIPIPDPQTKIPT